MELVVVGVDPLWMSHTLSFDRSAMVQQLANSRMTQVRNGRVQASRMRVGKWEVINKGFTS